ncbi:MAG: prephenate dehydrogenase/arogenate dehydrogenase family protein [Lachnospiraceae bacterium]|nr:prephenate dehydrogenase/arogenate dehydrogenase family protein [Lachnospiraceae bacterium]
MTVGVVGLGLIGGSFAKAYHTAGEKVLARELDKSVLSFAELSDDVDGELTKENIKDCDLILICVYPQAVIDFLKEFGPSIGKHPVVIDCCGTKRVPMTEGMKIAEKYGFLYVGGHPMAGTQYSGFKYAKENMFKGAPMVIVPPEYDNIMLLDRIKELLAPAGFRKITVTTAEKHDEMIAFTSQLAHVVSNAYVKSPTATKHKGFSAGSYKDMTRVAWLNPQMWAELFLDNRDYLINEIDLLIRNLTEYRDAIEKGDRERLVKILDDGKKRKEEVDG